MSRGGISCGIEKVTILLEVQEGRCAYCDIPIARGKKRGGLPLATLDHVWPRSDAYRGSDAIDNLLAVCKPCNEAKANRPPTADELAILARFAPRALWLWHRL